MSDYIAEVLNRLMLVIPALLLGISIGRGDGNEID